MFQEQKIFMVKKILQVMLSSILNFQGNSIFMGKEFVNPNFKYVLNLKGTNTGYQGDILKIENKRLDLYLVINKIVMFIILNHLWKLFQEQNHNIYLLDSFLPKLLKQVKIYGQIIILIMQSYFFRYTNIFIIKANINNDILNLIFDYLSLKELHLI